MAQQGITGPRTALEGDRGYFHAFAGDVDGAAEHVLDDLGVNWRLHDVYHKLHACCRALHSAIDALLEIRNAEKVQWPSVRRVTIRTYGKEADYNSAEVSSLVDAQMSLPLVSVLALREGKVGNHEIEVARSTVHARDMARVHVVHDTNLDGLYPPLRPTIAVVETESACYERYVEIPYGEPKNPVTDADVAAKFEALVVPALGPQQTSRVAAAVLSDNDMSARAFVRLLSAPDTAPA